MVVAWQNMNEICMCFNLFPIPANLETEISKLIATLVKQSLRKALSYLYFDAACLYISVGIKHWGQE